ncbi:coiled-coil domain-containing protein 50 isoform X1 [Arapaima gigas]
MADFSVDQNSLPGVKEVCRDFAVLEDHTLAYSLQEQEIENHLASNIHKSRLVQQDLQVAKRLQEEEDLRAKAHIQRKQKDIERSDNEIAQEIQEQLVKQAEQQRQQEEKDEAIARMLQEKELKEERRRQKQLESHFEEDFYEEKGASRPRNHNKSHYPESKPSEYSQNERRHFSPTEGSSGKNYNYDFPESHQKEYYEQNHLKHKRDNFTEYLSADSNQSTYPKHEPPGQRREKLHLQDWPVGAQGGQSDFYTASGDLRGMQDSPEAEMVVRRKERPVGRQKEKDRKREGKGAGYWEHNRSKERDGERDRDYTLEKEWERDYNMRSEWEKDRERHKERSYERERGRERHKDRDYNMERESNKEREYSMDWEDQERHKERNYIMGREDREKHKERDYNIEREKNRERRKERGCNMDKEKDRHKERDYNLEREKNREKHKERNYNVDTEKDRHRARDKKDREQEYNMNSEQEKDRERREEKHFGFERDIVKDRDREKNGEKHRDRERNKDGHRNRGTDDAVPSTSHAWLGDVFTDQDHWRGRPRMHSWDNELLADLSPRTKRRGEKKEHQEPREVVPRALSYSEDTSLPHSPREPGKKVRGEYGIREATQGISRMDLREQELKDLEVARRLQEEELKASEMEKRAAQVAQDEEIARLLMEEEKRVYKKSRDREKHCTDRRPEGDGKVGYDEAVRPRSREEYYQKPRNHKADRPPSRTHDYENVESTYMYPAAHHPSRTSSGPETTNKGSYNRQ